MPSSCSPLPAAPPSGAIWPDRAARQRQAQHAREGQQTADCCPFPGSLFSSAVPVGLPVTDRGQAPPLLRRGPGVEPVATLLEVADDAHAVLDGLGVVVL